MDLEIYLN